jgi:uncharacterized lipoprotein YmbA
MKKIKITAAIFASIASTAIVGCTTTQQTTAYNTIGAVEAAGKTAYDGYAALVIAGTVPTNTVPQASEAYNQLQADALLAATLSSEGTNAIASTNLTADLSALATVVATAKSIQP